MSRLTPDGTAEPVSRDQIVRHEGELGNIICLCVQKVVYILEVQLWYSCLRNYNCQYLWVTLVAQYRVTSVYFIAVYHECALRKGSKNTPFFDCNVV